jgi:hypothetical protein
MVREALQREGVPVTDALLDFHQTFAGYVERDGRDEFVYGLLHRQPKWLDPLQVDAFQDDESARVWYIACADGHPSYDLRIDQSGIYYTTYCVPRASSFFMLTEQAAFVWEFAKERKGRNAPLWLWHSAHRLQHCLTMPGQASTISH